MDPYEKEKVDLTEINAECATVAREYWRLRDANDPRAAEVYEKYKHLCAKRAQMMG